MKKFIILPLFLLTLTISAIAQTSYVKVLSNEQVVGRNLITDREITALKYTFPVRIHEFETDSVNNRVTLQLRNLSRKGKFVDNEGKLVQFDLNTGKALWSRDVYFGSSFVQQFKSTLFINYLGKTTLIDNMQGTDLWKIKNGISEVNHTYGIGIGYRYRSSSGYSDELRGIDLSSGKVVWERILGHKYGWNDLFYINDSIVVIASSGLHAVNLRTGRGWDYHAIAGKNDYTSMVAANAAGLALGLLTGAFVMTTGHDIVTGLVSNVILEDSSLYMATREEIVCLDKNTGKSAWRYPLPKDMGSNSSLFYDDDKLYLINYGFGYLGYRKVKVGEPFLAVFDKATGTQEYVSLINTLKDPVSGYEVIDDEIYLLSGNLISVYSINDGYKRDEKVIEPDSENSLEYFTGSNIFIERDGRIQSLFELWPGNLFIVNSAGNIHSVNSQLKVEETFLKEDLLFYHNNYSGYRLISKDDNCIVTDNYGNRIAEFKASAASIIQGDLLIDKSEGALVLINLKDALNAD